MAFFVICEPHVGLTTLTLTSSTLAPVAFGEVLLDRGLDGRRSGRPTWTRRRCPLEPERVWILASTGLMPFASSTLRASSTVCAVGLELPGHAALEVDAEVQALEDQRDER